MFKRTATTRTEYVERWQEHIGELNSVFYEAGMFNEWDGERQRLMGIVEKAALKVFPLENGEEYLHLWAQELLTLIKYVDPGVVGGIGGMGSDDGYYTTKVAGTAIMERFENDSKYVVKKIADGFQIAKENDPAKGFLVCVDQDFPEEVCLYFFDDTM